MVVEGKYRFSAAEMQYPSVLHPTNVNTLNHANGDCQPQC